MARDKKQRATLPGPDDAAVQKRTTMGGTEKQKKKDKKKKNTKKNKEDAYARKERLDKERLIEEAIVVGDIIRPASVEPDVVEIHLDELDDELLTYDEEPYVMDLHHEEINNRKPVVQKPIKEVNKIMVDDEVPRKRETTSYDEAEREWWTNPMKIEDLDLHVSHLDDRPTPLEEEYARYTAALQVSGSEDPPLEPEEEEGKEDCGEAVETTQPEPFKRKRWVNEGPAINDINDAPQDWDENEPDLHPLDYDAQIERCLERIQDNILPVVFQEKMKKFEELKASREKFWAEREKKYPGLDPATVARVETLVQMRDLLAKQENDRFEQMVNIEALISAYMEGKLKWYGNMFVTYWSCGVQRSEPRGFKMKEFACLSQHFPKKSFWVEGMNGPMPEFCGMAAVKHKYVDDAANPSGDYKNYMRISVMLPGGWNYRRYTFMQDTGATFMTIYENDLHHLQLLDYALTPGAAALAPLPGVAGGLIAPAPAGVAAAGITPVSCHGCITIQTVAGPAVFPVTTVQVCIHDEPAGQELTTWDTIQAVILPQIRITQPIAGFFATPPRLDGAWPRWKLYRGSCPWQLEGTTYVSQKKQSIVSSLTHLPAGVNYAKTALGIFGPPPPPGAPASDANVFPGPYQLAPPASVPNPMTLVGDYPAAGHYVMPHGVAGPPAGVGGVFGVAKAPVYAGPAPSWWDQ